MENYFEQGEYVQTQKLADLCRMYVEGEIPMRAVLQRMNLPNGRSSQAAYKMLVALRKINLAKRGIGF